MLTAEASRIGIAMGQHTLFVKTSRERCADRGSVNEMIARGQRLSFVKRVKQLSLCDEIESCQRK